MHMEIGYTVVQSIRRGYWIWTVQTEPPKTGEAPGKDLASRKLGGRLRIGFCVRSKAATSSTDVTQPD